MKESEPIDLSELDPARDAERWAAYVSATQARVDAVLAARADDPFRLIAGWARPVLAAAAVALAVLVPVEIALERRESRAEQVERLVTFSATVGTGAAPSGAAFVRALAEEPQP